MNKAPDYETCQAWDEHDKAPGLGYCRRRPPQSQHISMDDGGLVITIWPETEAQGDGCFDHVAILKKADPRKIHSPEIKVLPG